MAASSAAPADDGILGSKEKWLALLLSNSVERKGMEKGHYSSFSFQCCSCLFIERECFMFIRVSLPF